MRSSIYLFNDLERFHKGDEVRIYYRMADDVIENMKKMTPVEYKKEEQNQGYLFKKD